MSHSSHTPTLTPSQLPYSHSSLLNSCILSNLTTNHHHHPSHLHTLTHSHSPLKLMHPQQLTLPSPSHTHTLTSPTLTSLLNSCILSSSTPLRKLSWSNFLEIFKYFLRSSRDREFSTLPSTKCSARTSVRCWNPQSVAHSNATQL